MRLSIATKIFVAFAGIIAVFSCVVILSLLQSRRLSDELHALNRSVIPLSLLLSDAQNDLKSFDVALSEREPEALHRTLKVAQQMSIVPQRFARKLLRATELSHPDLFTFVDEGLRLRMGELHRRLLQQQRLAQSLDQRTQTLYALLDQRQPLETQEQLAALQLQLRDETRGIDQAITRQRNDLRILADLIMIRAHERERSNTYALTLMSALAMLIALAMLGAALLAVRPLRLLADAARRVGQGDYDAIDPRSLHERGRDEIATLTREFVLMAQNLRARDLALQEQHAALLRSERLAAIGRMTSIITHEVRNPLSSIGLNAEMLADMLVHATPEDALRQELLDHLEIITGEIDRLHEITEQYLVLARSPSPRYAPLNLVELIEQLVDFHQLEWAQRGASLRLDLPAELPLSADASQLRQVLLNLIKNAVEASPLPAAHPLELRSWLDGPFIHLRLRDHGPGFPPELRERAFEPFYTSKAQGTGLGLPVAQQIIEAHHGTLRIEDPEDGPGCVLHLTLPRHPPQEPRP